jgi:transposase
VILLPSDHFGEDGMTLPLAIRTDLFSSTELRAQARRTRNRRTAMRMLAIANALEGMSRADAARVVGMERQALRDAVIRYNAEGQRRRARRVAGPSQAGAATASKRGRAGGLAGAHPARAGSGARRLPAMDLAALVPLDRSTLRQAAAPGQLVADRARRARPLSAEDATRAPASRSESPDGVRQRGLRRAVAGAAEAHPERQITLWFMDEARVGQKGRTAYQWWIKGERPRGLCDQGFESTYIYGAVRPATGEDFALVLPEVSTGTMGLFLDRFAATLPPNTQAVLVLDRAGWHRSRRLRVPETITLVPLPAYSPELNPVERIWLSLREEFLTHCVFNSMDEIITACCEAWNSLTAERLRSLCNYPWIARITS